MLLSPRGVRALDLGVSPDTIDRRIDSAIRLAQHEGVKVEGSRTVLGTEFLTNCKLWGPSLDPSLLAESQAPDATDPAADSLHALAFTALQSANPGLRTNMKKQTTKKRNRGN